MLLAHAAMEVAAHVAGVQAVRRLRARRMRLMVTRRMSHLPPLPPQPQVARQLQQLLQLRRLQQCCAELLQPAAAADVVASWVLAVLVAVRGVGGGGWHEGGLAWIRRADTPAAPGRALWPEPSAHVSLRALGLVASTGLVGGLVSDAVCMSLHQAGAGCVT